MKTLILCLLITSSVMFSQQDDKFMKLDSNDRFSFNSPFNQKYQIFPQFTNLYQGFIVKPYERQGYYAWLQLKQDGYLRDTIIWTDNAFVELLLTKLPFDNNLKAGISLENNKLTNRGKILSSYQRQIGLKQRKPDISTNTLMDSNLVYDENFVLNYSKFIKLNKDECWEITTTYSKFEEVSLLGKSKNNLIVSKNNIQSKIDIGKIVSIKYKGSSLWYLGSLIGIPVGAVAGGLVGAIASGLNQNNVAANTGAAIGGAIFAIIGGLIFENFNTKPSIKLFSTEPYDNYFELDNKTYFTLQELGNDTTSRKIVNKEGLALVEREILRQNEQNKPQFSLGVGFIGPLNYNLNLQYYYDDFFGFRYTGFPLALSQNNNIECSRLGLFYRLNPGKKFYDQVGLQYSLRTVTFDDYAYYPPRKISLNFSEIGVFYDISIYGVFLSVNLSYMLSELYLNQARQHYAHILMGDKVFFDFQLGYRYTF